MVIRYPDRNPKLWWSEEYRSKIKDWHRRREVLRELLYLAGEENLILKDVPDWQRLKKQEQYIEAGDYRTPFSFILDFGNPVGMINLHGSAVWSAWHISQEFIEILSWQYPSLKGIRSHGQTA